MLVHHLPADSATVRALTPAGGTWGANEELLAVAIEALGGRLDIVAVFIHRLTAMFADRAPQPYKPEPLRIERPEGLGTPERPTGTNMAELATMLRLQRAGRKP